MLKPVVCPVTKKFFAENPEQIFTAVRFRGRVYVGSPRHKDAINLAFAKMTDLAANRVSHRIAEGKEQMLFGTAFGDGTGWEWNEEFQDARMNMYGFEPRYPS